MGKRRDGSPQNAKSMNSNGYWNPNRKPPRPKAVKLPPKAGPTEPVIKPVRPTPSPTDSFVSASSVESQAETARRVMRYSTLPSPDAVARANKTPNEAEHVRVYARAYALAEHFAGGYDESREDRAAFRQAHLGARMKYEQMVNPGAVLPDCPHDWQID